MSLLIRNARVVPSGGAPVIERADVAIAGATIKAVGQDLTFRADSTVNADGRVLLPGFIDAHTHALWAGDRLDEFDMKLRGATYLEVLRAGGGILSTVRAVRAASQEELTLNLRRRLGLMLREGTTTVEVKSGYGLNTVDELKMLRSYRRHP